MEQLRTKPVVNTLFFSFMKRERRKKSETNEKEVSKKSDDDHLVEEESEQTVHVGSQPIRTQPQHPQRQTRLG